MGARRATSRAGRAVLLAVVVPLLAGCSGPYSALDPDGPEAGRIAVLFWLMLALSAVVYALVLLLVFGLVRRRPRRRVLSDHALVIGGGIVLPIVVLLPLMGFNIQTLANSETGQLRIDVIGFQYWWEVTYADEQITGANEVHVPVGRPVELTLTSADVIHSFWVPELAGKVDLIPGHSTSLVIEAERPGVYRGQCAEYCGLQHANMAFFVVAHEAQDYETWLARARSPAPEPETAGARRGRQVFLESSCAGCHAVSGTAADGQLGPDLTHFASRLTIGAGAVENTRGDLGGWIANSQSIKPGNKMPPVKLEAQELIDLLDYLETLE